MRQDPGAIPEDPIEEAAMPMKPESLLAHADFVRALARSLVLDEHRADDVVQETWLAALERPPRIGGAVRSWLGTVVHNFAFMARRGEKRRTRREQAAARREAIASTARVVEWESVRRRVVEAVLSLEEPYRTAIVLRFYDGLPPRDIADQLGIPVETAKTHLKRDLARLRKRLDQEHGGDGKTWCLALAPIAGLKLGGATSASAGATSLTTFLSGAAAMTLKLKAGIAAGFLVFAAIAIYMLVKDDGSAVFPRETSAPPAASALERPQPSTKEAEAAAEPAAMPSKESVPPSAVENVAIHCRVTDLDGNPVEGASVETAEVDSYYTGSHMPEGLIWKETVASSGPNGRFMVKSASTKLLVTFLRVRHPDYYHESGRFFNDCIAVSTALPGSDGSYFLDDIRMAPARFIQGIVKDGGGKPVSGCTVSAPGTPWAPDPWANHDIVRTDGGGRFKLKVHATPRTCRTTAFHEEAGMGFSEPVAPGTGDSIPEVDILLMRCRPLAGELTYFDGTPAAGRTLFAAGTMDGKVVQRQAVADDEGRFEFAPLPEGAYEIKVKTDVRGSWEYVVLAKGISPGDTDLALKLPRTSLARIHLQDMEGRIVDIQPEIHLDQSVESPPPDYIHLHDKKLEYDAPGKAVRTGPGAFALHFLRESVLGVHVAVKGFSTCRFHGVEIPPPPGEIELNAVLEPMRSIHGKVVHADGKPARNIPVLVEWDEGFDADRNEPWRIQIFRETGARMRRNNSYCPRTFTDEEGCFLFTGLEPGGHDLYFMVKGLEVYHEGPVMLSGAEPRAELYITLPALGGSIEGTVMDGKGEPLRGASVMAWDGGRLFNTTRSDDHGRYAFSGLPDGRYVVDAQYISGMTLNWIGGQSGYYNSSDEIEDIAPFNAAIEAGNACRLDLTIEDCWTGTIQGRIIAGSAALPPSMYVMIHELAGNGQDVLWAPKQSPSRSPAVLFRYSESLNRRDEDERPDHFRFSNLREGRYKVSLSISGGTNPFGGEIVSEPFHLEPFSVHTVDIHLPSTSIKGVITDRATGEPVADARVILRAPTEMKNVFKTIEMKSGKDGNFERAAVPPGSYTLIIHHADHSPLVVQDFQVPGPENRPDRRYELESGSGVVKGVLRPAAGDWKNEGIWYVRPVVAPLGLYEYGVGWVDEEGAFSLNGLPAGPGKLVVFHSFQPVLEKTVTLPLPDGETLVIELP